MALQGGQYCKIVSTEETENLLVHGKSSIPGNNGIQLKESFISHLIAGKISYSEVWHGLEQRSGNQK